MSNSFSSSFIVIPDLQRGCSQVISSQLGDDGVVRTRSVSVPHDPRDRDEQIPKVISEFEVIDAARACFKSTITSEATAENQRIPGAEAYPLTAAANQRRIESIYYERVLRGAPRISSRNMGSSQATDNLTDQNVVPDPGRQSGRVCDDLLLRNAVNAAYSSLPRLLYPSNYHIKAFHAVCDSREFGVVSVNYADSIGQTRAFFGFLWQSMDGKSPNAVCVTFSIDENHALKACCSCDPLSDIPCQHIAACKNHPSFQSFATEKLSSPQHFSDYFGTRIEPNSSQVPLVELVRRRYNPQQSQSGFITREWAIWLIFDMEHNLFVPVLKKVHQTYQCLMCRGSKRIACIHESACPNLRFRNAIPRNQTNPNGGRYSGSTSADLQTYFVQKPRSLFPCKSELRAIKMLSERIDELNRESKQGQSRSLLLVDPFVTCEGSTTILTGENTSATLNCKALPFNGTYSERKATLFTVCDGAVDVVVRDWTCSVCRSFIPYSGTWDAVFPVRKESLYSTELMYALLENVFHWGGTVRSANGMMRSVSSSVSNVRKLPISQKIKDGERRRRRINEAFSLFVNSLSLDTEFAANMLFSCRECEVPLNAEDRRVLGIVDPDPSLKRLKGIVIDGTAAGIIGCLPEYQRQVSQLTCSRISETCLVSRRDSKKALKTLLQLSRTALSKAHQRRFRSDAHSLCFSLEKNLTKKHIDILRLHVDRNFCFCSRTHGNHTRDCMKKLETYGILNDSEEISAALQFLFRIQHEETPADEIDLSVTLDSDDVNGQDADEMEPGSNIAVTEPMVEANSGRSLRWVARFVCQEPMKISQLLDSMFELLLFITTENAVIVYVSAAPSEPLTMRTSLNSGDMSGFEYLEPGKPSLLAEDFARPSLAVHEKVSNALETFSNCNHAELATSAISICDGCVEYLKNSVRPIQEVNPILHRFCAEVLFSSKKFPSIAKEIAGLMSALLFKHILTAIDILQSLDAKRTDSCKEYAGKYGSALVSEMEAQVTVQSEDTGICFPGRRMFRPHILFDKKERYHCAKKYPESRLYTPGILTVQCVCGNPKCLGFIVMQQAESTALALSSVLSHLRIPPRVVYYDNGCNLVPSALYRVPWILHMTKIVVDRFHYKKGHKDCTSFFDASMYKSCDYQRSTTAESFNARLAKSISSLRHVKGEHLVGFLRTKFAILNLAALFRQKFGKEDIGDVSLPAFYAEECDCKCILCEANEPGPNADTDGTPSTG